MMADAREILAALSERMAVAEARNEELERQLAHVSDLLVKQNDSTRAMIASIEAKLEAHAQGSIARADQIRKYIALGFVRIEEFKTYRWMLQTTFAAAIGGLVTALIGVLGK